MGINGNLTYWSILIIIVSSLLYHVAQKATPSDINPLISLIITYFVAMIICIIVYIMSQQKGDIVEDFKKVNWAIFALGIAVLGIEIGFLYAYRAGWNISKANLLTSSMIVILLIPIGILFYNEKITLVNLVGVVCCIFGVGLINF